jgi:hypothetical protein
VRHWEAARKDADTLEDSLKETLAVVLSSPRFLALPATRTATRARTGERAAAWRERGRRLRWLVLPVVVLGAFVLYLYSLTGSWTAWYHAQSTGWARTMTPPWDSFWNTVAATGTNADHPLWPPVFTAEIVSMALGVLVVGWCLGRRLWAEASWVAVQVLAFSLSYWFMSVNRAVLLWFPLWMMVAHWATWRPERTAVRVGHRVLVGVVFAASVAAMLAWSWLYFTGNWAS